MSDGPAATCECTTCGRTFTTPVDEDGRISFDGVREHGSEHHTDTVNERWDYEIVDRPGGDSDGE